MWSDGFQWWMPFIGIGVMLFMVVVLGSVMRGVMRPTDGDANGSTANETSIEIARKRFARGEITREQFEEIEDSLRRSTERS